MDTDIVKYSWVETHKELVKYLAKNQNNQKGLIALLKKVGITGFTDKDTNGNIIELEELDPFSFFCFIYKFGPHKRLEFLQKIAAEVQIKNKPTDESGIPSTRALKVCMFPFKAFRINNEIARLWNFFFSIINDTISDEQFVDILKIRSVGKAKLTEALFNVNPDKYFPINGPSKPFLKEYLNIDPNFNNYSEYLNILKLIKEKVDKPFYELSFDSWYWNNKRAKVNYWIFQGNPKIFNAVAAIQNNALETWRVKVFKNEMKKGDKGILWLTGESPGCYALLELTSDVYEGLESEKEMNYYVEKTENIISSRVKLKITHNLTTTPITKSQIDAFDELSELKVGNQGTNFSATEDEYFTLLEIVETMNMKKYWLYAPGENADMWDEFYQQGIMALGWDELGDLNNYKTKEELGLKLQEIENTTGSKKNDATANYEFKNVVAVGDIIIAKKGRGELIGLGEVTSDCYYDANRVNYKNCRKVDWKKKGNWKAGHSLALKTLTDITRYKSENDEVTYYYERLINLIYGKKIEDLKFPLNTIFFGPPGTGKTYDSILRAAQIIENRPISDYGEAKKIFNQHLGDRIEFITFHQNYSYEDFIQGLRPDVESQGDLSFERKDGVFKRIADRALKNIAESENPQEIKKPFEAVFNVFVTPLIEGEVSEIEISMKKVAFFITNITNKSIQFRKASGGTEHTLSIATLKKMYDVETVLDIQGLSSYYKPLLTKLLELGKANHANKTLVAKQNYVIIIDEINRANISRVFGELITLIEPDKRSHGSIPLKSTLPSGDAFIVPSNLYIIGTMNTADKSIALLDIALRRRFVFEAMFPKYEIEGHVIYDTDILEKINKRIKELKGHDFQIGHSYFMGDNNELVARMNYKVIPLLLEYFLNDEKEVKGILSYAGLAIEPDSWPIKITGIL